MRSIRKRTMIIYALVFAFLAGFGVHVVRIFMNAKDWALNPSNTYLSADVTDLGIIKDCNDVILAKTEDGKRVYNKSSDVRRSMLHIVGDEKTSIATAIQTNLQSGLWGYNIVTGLNPPDFMSNKRDVKLTLDSKVCSVALNSMDRYKGAVAVYNYKTGKIVCMVSLPTFDPVSPPDFDKDYTGDYEGVYINRVLSASYAPGSVFKIITSIAALKYLPDIDSTNFMCNHEKEVGGGKLTCHSTHGSIGFNSAFIGSCNIAFGEISMSIGAENMTSNAKILGFGENFDISGVKTKASVYDVSEAGKLDLAWSGVGQYKDLLNPMHMLMILGAIANDGVPVMPYFVDEMISDIGVEKTKSAMGRSFMDSSHAKRLQKLMSDAASSYGGSSAFGGLQKVCAKTGTAEVAKGEKENAWIAGFSQDENTPYAFVAIMEKAGGGAKYAIPMISKVLRVLK